MKKLLSVIAVIAMLLMILGAGCMGPYGPGPGPGPRHSNDPGLFGPDPSGPPPPPPPR